MKKFLVLLLSFVCMMTLMACSGNGGNTAETDDTSETVTENKTVVSGDGTMLSILDNGAVGDGKTDDSAAFTSDDAGTLYIPAGKYKIAHDMEVNLPVKFELGAVLAIETGVKVKFNGYIDAPAAKIFEGGSVTLSTNSTSYPEWFGAVTDGVTDCTNAIQRAINCFPNGYGKVVFDAGTYIVSDSIKITASQKFLTLEGTSVQLREVSPGIKMKGSSDKPVLKVTGKWSGEGSYGGSLEGVTIKYLEFTRENMGGEGSDTIYLENVMYTTLEYVGFSHSQNGIHAIACNGLRIYACHGTTGGNIAGKEVRGIYIDGTEKGCTGILIDDYIYYGYSSTESISYAYKDVNSATSENGTNIGDRRIRNFECAGQVNYGIAIISESSGWGGDIAISDVSMDCVHTAGIYFYAEKTQTYQTANICNCYFHLDTEGANALKVENYTNVNVSTFTVDNACGDKVTGIYLYNSFGGTIESTVFTGQNYKEIVNYTKCKECVFTANTCVFSGAITLDDCRYCIVTANSMPKVSYSSDSTDNLKANNIFAG